MYDTAFGLDKIKLHQKICDYCGCLFLASQEQKEKRHCSRVCTNKNMHSKFSREKKEEIAQKTRDTLAKTRKLSPPKKLKRTKECPVCHCVFDANFKRQISCSVHCAAVARGRKAAATRVVRSKNEIQFYELCLAHWPDAVANIPMFNGWDADVIIPSLKLAVMWNGVWRYKENLGRKHSLSQVQNRDRIKTKEIAAAGYQLYTVVDMGRANSEFVAKSFATFSVWLGSRLPIDNQSNS